MDKRTIIIGSIVFVLIVAGMFIFSYLKQSELEVIQPEMPTEVETEVEGLYDYIDRIDAKHFYIDGTHTLAGEILLPTPCDLLNWDVTVAESFPEQVTVEFSVVNSAEACAEVMTAQRFKVSFGASEEAIIKALFMGREVELNLIPAAEGETPDDFELFIKG